MDEEEGTLNESPKALKTSRDDDADSSSSIATALDQAIQHSVLPSIKPIGKPVGRSPVAKSFRPFGRRPGKHASSSSRTNNRRPGLDGRRTSRTTMTKSESVDSTSIKLSPVTTGPSSWFFDIYVDTAEDEATNAMHHSTGCLDISDDEEKKAKVDDRGKENIPPHELGITMPTSSSTTQTATQTTSTTDATNNNNNTAATATTANNNSTTALMRKILMAYEQRAPLAELKASDYYAAGLHALSYAVILEDDNESDASPSKPAVNTTAEAATAAA